MIGILLKNEYKNPCNPEMFNLQNWQIVIYHKVQALHSEVK